MCGGSAAAPNAAVKTYFPGTNKIGARAASADATTARTGHTHTHRRRVRERERRSSSFAGHSPTDASSSRVARTPPYGRDHMHAQKSTHMITNKPLAVAVDVDAAVVAVPKRQATERTQAHVRTSVVSAVGSKRSQRTACLLACAMCSRGECGCGCACSSRRGLFIFLSSL